MTEPATRPRTVEPRTWTLRARLGAAALAGLLTNLAFPPFDVALVALVGLAALALALDGLGGRHAAAAGAVYGLLLMGPLIHWLWISAGVLAWVALTLLQAAFFAAAALAWTAAARGGPVARIAGAALTFTAVEIARARMPIGGFTWGAAGMTQVGSPLDGFAPWGGMHLVSLVVVALGVLLAEAVLRRVPRVALAALVLVPLAGALLPQGAGPETGVFDVAAVQGNVPRHRFTIGRGREGPEDEVIVRNHLAATRTLIGARRPDLVVWPENAFDRDPRDHPELFGPTQQTIRDVGAPFLVGAIMGEGDGFSNTNLHIAPDGTIVGRYDKLHLVPFGEYVPATVFRRLVPILDEEIPQDGIPGREVVVFDVRGRRVGSVICFESAYPSLVRRFVSAGAQIVVVTTNDASFGTTPAAAQHLAHSRMRAIENGRAVVHTAIAGISALILPDGSVHDRAELFTQDVLRAPMPLHAGLTPYARWGNLVEVALLLLGVGALGRAALR